MILDAKRSSRSVRSGPRSVGRVLSILDVLADNRGGATLSELAVKIGAPKTSLVDLLSGLAAEDCLARDRTGRYFLGPRFLSLAMRAIAGRELFALARPVLNGLVESTGETAVLGALAPDADIAIYLDKVESANSIRYAVTVGERRELYCTAIGKVLLAQFEPARLKRYLKLTPRKQFTVTTITRASDLRIELSRILRDGIARSKDERVGGATGLASPIFSSDGTVVAGILIAGPSERMRVNARENERLVKGAASECTRLVGGVPPVLGREA